MVIEDPLAPPSHAENTEEQPGYYEVRLSSNNLETLFGIFPGYTKIYDRYDI